MEKDNLDFQGYLKVLKNRSVTLIFVFLVVYAMILAVTFTMTPIYKATAQVYIDPATSDLGLQQQPAAQVDPVTYTQTQIGIIKSEAIAKKVVSKLHLDQLEQSRREKPNGLGKLLGTYWPRDAQNDGADSLHRTINAFRENLEVTAVKNSNLVNVSYESGNPALAATIVNATVQAFVEQNIEMKVTPAKEAVNWLNKEMADIKEKMNQSSDQLQEFKRQKGIIVTGDKQSNISLQALSDLNSKVLAAEAKRSEAEIKYRQVLELSKSPEGVMSHPDVINDKLIQDIKAQRGLLAKEIADNEEKLGAKHPKMVQLRSEMDSLNKQMENESNLVISSLKTDYEQSLKAEQSLKRAFDQQKTEAMNYEKRSTEYEIKNQDVEGARDLYTSMLKKFQESTLIGNINLSSAQVLDEASVPISPVRPKKQLNIILGFIISIIAGVSSAFVVERLDNTCKSPEDIEDALGLPFLGIVPTNKAFQGKHDADLLEVISFPTSPVAESFRNIRSNILMTKADEPPKVIQTCSAMHSEGKSTFSYNLACIMAAMGDSVVLIDGDMRKPKMHSKFGMQNKKGLSSLLSQQSSPDQVILGTKVPNLSIITSGPIPPNPGELLGSATMKSLIKSLRERFDRIIIDSPAFLGIADAALLAAVSDGVVMVVRSGLTSKDHVTRAQKSLDSINIKILGVVLNDQSKKSVDYYQAQNYNHYYTDKRVPDIRAARS
ncbi:MAG: polysaccharide biosynthesis tyrosine autokinase [Nitrospirota bacterium]